MVSPHFCLARVLLMAEVAEVVHIRLLEDLLGKEELEAGEVAVALAQGKAVLLTPEAGEVAELMRHLHLHCSGGGLAPPPGIWVIIRSGYRKNSCRKDLLYHQVNMVLIRPCLMWIGPDIH